MTSIVLESTICCSQRETMPTDACQFYYECAGCHALLRPKPGDCCVFCSYVRHRRLSAGPGRGAVLRFVGEVMGSIEPVFTTADFW